MNVGNFTITHKGGIVVLTLSVGCYYYIRVYRSPKTSNSERGIAVPRFCDL